MNKNIIIGIVVALILIGGLSWYFFSSKNTNPTTITPSTNTPSTQVIQNETKNIPKTNPVTNTVIIQNFAFFPTELTIKQGDTVTWINKDSATHTVTSLSGNEMDSKQLGTGETYSHVFATIGSFDYHCSIHTMMNGKIIVQ